MRRLRILFILLVVSSLLNWTVATVPASAAPAAAGPASPAASPASSASITVTTTADEWDDGSKAASANTKCSLREALQLAYSFLGNQGCGKAIPDSDITIQIPGGTYVLTNLAVLPNIGNGHTITINAPGVTIDGGANQQFETRQEGIFRVVDGTLILKNLTLQDGSHPGGGGALWLQGGGTVIADNVKFSNNQAIIIPGPDQNGGAILDDSGDLTVTNSIFMSNNASGGGGAVATKYGYFFNDKFINNTASRGGAFYDSSPTTYPVIIEQSTFKANKATAVYDMPDSSYAPYADPFGGGAIANYGNLQVLRSSLQNNSTELTKGGGAVYNQGSMLMSECVMAQNTVQAQGSSESSPYVKYAFGGAVINYNVLDLVRCSIYNNTADYAGAILNHGADADLNLYNTTVGNNTANRLYGGVVNDISDPSIYGQASNAASVFLVHTTIGKNKAGISAGGDTFFAAYKDSIYFANSILDGDCAQEVYSRGGSVASGPCPSAPDPLAPIGTGLVQDNNASINLQPLSPGNATVNGFRVQRIDNNSSAAGLGGPYDATCSDPHIGHRDANLAVRPPNSCDAGAIQSNAPPPNYASTPPEGVVTFPIIDLAQSSGANTTLTIQNTGGGALEWTLEDDGGSANITNQSGFASGTILKTNGQNTAQTNLTFNCSPQAVGDYWRDISINTNAPNRKKASYKLHCIVKNSNAQAGQASMDTEPGPLSMTQPGLGGSSQVKVVLNNVGVKPVAASWAWENLGIGWSAPVQVPAGPSSPAGTTVPPGGNVQITLTCTPPGYGLFTNTFDVTTTDPINPVIHYNVSCETRVDNPPEDLRLGAPYPNAGTEYEGVAVSPDGTVVAAGAYESNLLYLFHRHPPDGTLTSLSVPPCGCAPAPNGWTQIYGVAFSHDGTSLYATSQSSNGIAIWSTSSLNVQPSEVNGTVWVKGSQFSCTPGPCFIHTMGQARGVAVSPDDQYVYVTGYNPGDFTVFTRNAGGGLWPLQVFDRAIDSVNVLGGAARVATSPDGSFVYVADMTDYNVAVFQRQPGGLLTFQGATALGQAGPSDPYFPTDLAVSPDGSFLYVATPDLNGSLGAIQVFSISGGDGRLTLVKTFTDPVSEPKWGVAVTSDPAGRRVISADWFANFVQVNGRNPASGAPSYVDRFSLDGPVFIALSPDNLFAYITQWSNALAGTGGLQMFQTFENAPIASHLSPASAVLNSGAFTLTVVGGRFYANSQVRWNGTALPTVFVDENTLQASVPGSAVAGLGSASVTVHNPTPGGGDSSALTFAIVAQGQPQTLSITSLYPPDVDFGGGVDLTVLVQGANFAPDALVYYNRQPVQTLFINDHTLQITLSADILSTPGDGGLQVVNGGGAPSASAAIQGPSEAAGSGSSASFAFTVHAPGVPGHPALTSLVPASVLTVSAPVWLTVLGHNFSTDPIAGSVGLWNGQLRPTVVVDQNTLLMQINASDRAAPANALITVMTPDVGVSHPLHFRVRGANEKPVPVVSNTAVNGWTLQVNGSDFDSGAQVRFNGVPRATTFVNQYELTMALAPSDRVGLLTVSNPTPGGGLSNTLVVQAYHLFLPIIRR